MSKEKYNGETTLAKLIRNIGTWLNDKVSKSTAINGKALNTNIELTAEDVGAIAGNYTFIGTLTTSVSLEFDLTNHKGLLLKVNIRRGSTTNIYHRTMFIPKEFIDDTDKWWNMSINGISSSDGAGVGFELTTTTATYNSKWENGHNFIGLDFYYYD